MKIKIKYLILLFLISLAGSTVSSSARVITENLEWKVNVGDSMTYTISKYFDIEDSDGNGDPESTILLIQNEAGEKVNITYGKGSKYTTKITALNGLPTGQTTYGSIVAEERTIAGVVIKTTGNKSYWEEYANAMSSSNTSIGSVTIEGDYLVTTSDYGQGIFNVSMESIVKYNWKTGWHTYSYSKTSNTTHTISEFEITTGSSIIPGFEISSIFFGLFIITLVISRKRRK